MNTKENSFDIRKLQQYLTTQRAIALTPKVAADMILSKYWDESFPVNPIQIANNMGLIVYATKDVRPNSGMIKKDENGKMAIFINANDPKPKQRFAILHELGHFALHPDYIEEQERYNLVPKYDNKEFEADCFAMEVLIPRSYLATAVNRGHSFKEMTRIFQCSKHALSRRIRELNLV